MFAGAAAHEKYETRAVAILKVTFISAIRLAGHYIGGVSR
jgi:hypothetical protein